MARVGLVGDIFARCTWTLILLTAGVSTLSQNCDHCPPFIRVQMLSSRSTVVLRRGLARSLSTTSRRALSSHDSHPHHNGPRPAVELDPGLLELLNESGNSLKGLKQKNHPHPNPPAELHVYDDLQLAQSTEVARLQEEEDDAFESREERRSPAAVFGSDRPAHIKLSEELREAIQALVDSKLQTKPCPSVKYLI